MTEKPSVETTVRKKLDECFSDGFDWSRIEAAVQGAAKLFIPSEQAVFHPFFKADVAIPCVPGKDEPSLLLYNLGKNQEYDEKQPSYKYINDTKTKGPGALYGTSGAGKTRCTLEYLSYNKGLYLVAHGQSSTAEELGSFDLEGVFQRQGLELLSAKDKDKEKNKLRSLANLAVIESRIAALMFIRRAVHDYVVHKLEMDLSPLQWLMLQLYPEHYFGDDIFARILAACVFHADVFQTSVTALSKVWTTQWHAIVVDESQMLLKRHNEYFCSQEEGNNSRCSGFSAVFRGLDRLRATRATEAAIPYPLFSGTAMSLDEMHVEAATALVKRQATGPRHCFQNFPALDVEGVKHYMNQFLQFDVGEEVLDHVAKWLTGRPRWTATFLEEYMLRPSKHKLLTTRGSFTEREKLLVEALDRYIQALTQDRRQSWQQWPGRNKTPWTAIERAMTMYGHRQEQNSLELAVYHYAFGQNTHLVHDKSKIFIEKGVGRLKYETENPSQDAYTVTIDEPLIMEAGIQYFGLNHLVEVALQGRQHSGGLGDSFEEMAVVNFRSNLTDLIVETFPNSDLEGLSVLTKSSYGIMVKSCKNQDQKSANELLDWIRTATSAKFEGSVPPFCFPSELFGPGVISLLRGVENYTNYGTLLCQAKLKKKQSQPEALLTIFPEWLFYENRDKPGRALTKKLDLRMWHELKSNLVAESIPLLRCLVEYPVSASKSSATGRIKRNSIELWKGKEDSGDENRYDSDEEKSGEKLDWLLTVDGKGVNTLFDEGVCGILKALKGAPPEGTEAKKKSAPAKQNSKREVHREATRKSKRTKR